MRALGTILLNDIPEAVAARIDWQEMFATERPAFLRAWAPRQETSPEQPSGNEGMHSRESFLGLAPDVLDQKLTDVLTGMLAGILRLDSPESIDTQMPLDDYGLDSLTATELRNKLASHLEVVLPIGQLIGGRSIADLTDQLKDHLVTDDSSHRTAFSGSDEPDMVEILI